MTQALWTEDGSLPQGHAVQNAHTKLRKGSKNAVVVVRNSTAYPQTLKKKTPVATAVAMSCSARTASVETRLPEGVQMSLKALTHLSWLLDRDKGSYLKS